VSDAHKVLTALIVAIPSNCCCGDFSEFSQIMCFSFFVRFFPHKSELLTHKDTKY
jgi:hypothetical protein